MKNLLDLSRQRKQASRLPTNALPLHKPHPSSKPPLFSPQPSPPPSQQDSDFQPSETEILDYAQFLGIDPSKQKHLLHIARQGLITPVPPPWEAIENGEEVVYVNRQTKQRTLEHPLDEFFRELVVHERKRMKGGGGQTNVSSQGVVVAPLRPNFAQQQQQQVDPLLQLELQRKKRKNEEDARLKFAEKKKELQEGYRRQEEEVKQEYHNKTASLREKYEEEENALRDRNRRKLLDLQQESQLRIDKQISLFEEKMRRELQGTLERRVAAEKEAMAVVFERRRAERGREMEERYRGRRKEVEEEYERRRGEIGRREEGIRGEVEGLERRLARGLQEAREEMVERGLGEYQGRIEEHRVGEERRYLEEVRRLEQEHNSNLSALASPSVNTASQTPSLFSLTSFIQQLQASQQVKLQTLAYEISAYRSLRLSQIQNSLLDYSQELETSHQNKLDALERVSKERLQGRVAKLQKDLRWKEGQLQKKVGGDLLRHLEEFERVYEREESMVVGGGKKRRMGREEEQGEEGRVLRRLEEEYGEVSGVAVGLKRELERVRLEYETAKEGLEVEEREKGAVVRGLTEEQRRMYERVVEFDLRIVNERREMELKEMGVGR